MATLTVYGVNDEGARVALDTPGARVVVATIRGQEARRIVEISGKYFTRESHG